MFDAKTLDAWLTHIEVLHSKPIDLGLDRMKTMVEPLPFVPPTVMTVRDEKSSPMRSTMVFMRSSPRSMG